MDVVNGRGHDAGIKDFVPPCFFGSRRERFELAECHPAELTERDSEIKYGDGVEPKPVELYSGRPFVGFSWACSLSSPVAFETVLRKSSACDFERKRG